MSRAETPKETISQGLMPSARTQMGSVLERWLKARSIWDSASTQKAHGLPGGVVRHTDADPVGRGGEQGHKNPLGHHPADQVPFKQGAGPHRRVFHNIFAGRVHPQRQGGQGGGGQVDPQDMDCQQGGLPVQRGGQEQGENLRDVAHPAGTG